MRSISRVLLAVVLAALSAGVWACSRTASRGTARDARGTAPTAPSLPATITCHDRAWPAVLAAVEAYCTGANEATVDASRGSEARAMDCSTMRSALAPPNCAHLERRRTTFDLVMPDFEVRFHVDDEGLWSVQEVRAGF
jgi:hypothetical protein